MSFVEKDTLNTLPAVQTFYRCLGQSIDDYPATPDFPAGICMTLDGSEFYGGTYHLGIYDQPTIDALQLPGSLPSSKSAVPITFTYTDSGTPHVIKVRGVSGYFNTTGTTTSASIVWFAKSQNDCGDAAINAPLAGFAPTSGAVNCSLYVGK